MINKMYVLYDKANDHVVRWSNGNIILYANKEDAKNDCYGNEYVVLVTELPYSIKETILKQLK
jgi:hypothetical protein